MTRTRNHLEMRGKSEEEHRINCAIAKKEKKDYRKAVIQQYFLSCSRELREWFETLVRRYKARGQFPVTPMTLLHSYYEDPQDKTIAVLVSMLVPSDNDVIENVTELRNVLGRNPYEWFRRRGFVSMSTGSQQNLKTAGITNWRISRFLDLLWNECNSVGDETIEESVRRVRQENYSSFADAILLILNDLWIKNKENRIRLALLILGTSDGLGTNAWSIPSSDIKTPISVDLLRFLRIWFPNYRLCFDRDEAIEIFGLGSDFYYAHLAFRELQMINPDECKAMAAAFHRWYKNGIYRKPNKKRKILPEIPF